MDLNLDGRMADLATWTYSAGKRGVVTGTVDRDSPESQAALRYLLLTLWPQMFTGQCDQDFSRKEAV